MKVTPNQRWLKVAVALLALGVTALDRFHGYDQYLVGLNIQRTLLPLRELKEIPASGKPLTQHVTLLFLDGLNHSEAQKLPNLSGATPKGVMRPFWVEFPSFTYPAVIAYNTGVPPLYSGTRINQAADRTIHMPSLTRQASQAGLQVRLSSNGWTEFHMLLDTHQSFPEISIEQALSSPKRPGLDWLYFGEIDDAGHEHGRESEEYQAAARRGDALVAKVLAATDLTKETVIVVSDHGHLARGGHGGAEREARCAFFFAIGAGIVEGGSLPDTSYLDLVPTVAMLLGLPVPAASLGLPMLDILQLSDTEKAKYFSSAFLQRIQVEASLSLSPLTPRIEEIQRRLSAGDTTALPEAFAKIAKYQRQREEAFSSERDTLGAHRLLLATSFFMALLAMLIWLRRQNYLVLRVRDLVPTLLYTVLFMSLYYACGYRLSWSLPRGAISFMIETLLFGLIGVIAAFWVSRKLSAPQRLLEETVVMTLFFGVPYLLASSWEGLDARYLGDPSTSYLVIFFATIGFYGHGPFAIALLLKARK